ncbi:hypothetical protein ACU81Q_10195 [Komagataeibacter melomenusus]
MSYDHAARLAQHEMKEAVCRSFHFSRPNSSAYWFNLMWIPGKLILTGDGCDMTLTHHHACSSFDAAIKWASCSEMDYLLRAAKQQQKYDVHATLQEIIRWANAPVIEDLNGGWDEHYVPITEDGKKRYRTVRTPRRDGLRHLCQDYRRAIAAGTQDEFLEDPKAVDPRCIVRLKPNRDRPIMWEVDHDPHRLWDFDPCWDRWLSLWKDTVGADWHPGSNYNTPVMVAAHEGRWRIKDALERLLDEPGPTVLRCMCDLDVECVYRWSWAQEYQIEAIRFACGKILAAGLVNMEVVVP